MRPTFTPTKKLTAQDRESEAAKYSTLQAIFVPQFSAFFKAEVAIHTCSGDGDAQRYVHPN
jgi:hypothetical protein